ncbi:MAG TPA: fibronectin type III domain-containing protein [Pirellulaceae bacterium]|nr:fibronectin type III domain-containing protein [Pirellulaceae bacterium]
MQRIIVATVIGVLVAAPLWAQDTAPPRWADHPENQWVRQSPRDDRPAPNFPYEGSGSYDPFHRKWIHHAGHDGIPQGFHTFTFDLDDGRWEQKFPPTSPPGVCCVDGTNVFDIAHRRFVRFPGGSLGHGFQWSRGVKLKESAVWTYDLASNAWTNMRPPPYGRPEQYSRQVVGGLCSGATYDPNHELVLTFGGQSSGGSKDALFAYDTYANALYFLNAENPPPARDGMGLAYDAGHDKLVMFGSQYLDDPRTWIYDLKTNRWEVHELTPHPPAHKVTKDYCSIPRLVYDSASRKVLCLAWLGEEGHETWMFDTGKLTWTKMNPVAEPAGSKSRSRNLSFDAARNLVILESSSAKTNRPEIWTYRYRQVDPAAPAPLLPPQDLRVVVADGGKARLSWKASLSADVKQYHIYRAAAEEPWKAEFARTGSTPGTEFQDQGLQSGLVYFYVVKSASADGKESPSSLRARTQPRVLVKPVVSVLAHDRVEVTWNDHPASDIVGYNLYRGLVKVRTVKKGTLAPWRDNDPEYAQPQVVEVDDIVRIEKLNEQPLTKARYTDNVELSNPPPESGDYRLAVYAYIVRAVNKLGTESGPSPYALTLPSEPQNVFCREEGEWADLKWQASQERGVTGYHVYQLKGTWEIVRVTNEPLMETTFRHQAGNGTTRYWIVAVDALGQEGQPSSPVWFNHSHRGFFAGDWHQ